jgi:tRNA pseudouridine38-40 synthase
VEGEIRSGLVRTGLAPDLAAAAVSVASRTDRGVHARANALTFRSEIAPEALLRALDGISSEIWFTHSVEVPDGFRPRSAKMRWYRYFERPADIVPDPWRATAGALTGPLDARTFARGFPPSDPAFRTVDSIRAGIEGGWLVLDVRAKSFAWGMVRKIVAAIREVESGRVTPEALEAAAAGARRLTLPTAEADRLVLWETLYPVPWTTARTERTGGQTRRFAAEASGALARARIVAELAQSGKLAPFDLRARSGKDD